MSKETGDKSPKKGVFVRHGWATVYLDVEDTPSNRKKAQEIADLGDQVWEAYLDDVCKGLK